MRTARLPLLAVCVALCAGCRDNCARAIDHIAHLARQDTLQELTGDQRRAAAPLFSSEAMLPAMREIIRKRLGERCHDPALTRCILAARDSRAVVRCEHPEW